MVITNLGNSKIPIDTILELCKLYKTSPNELLGFTGDIETTELSKIYKLNNFINRENIKIDELIKFISSAKKIFN